MNKTSNDGFFPTAIEQATKHENQAKFLHRQIVPLNEQNHNLKDYIIAMNYYLASRCKDFSSVLRMLPERQIIIQMADLVTIYDLVKEDVEYYQKRIIELEADRVGMRESVQRMREREEYCKISCSAKIEEMQLEIIDLKQEQAREMEEQRKTLTKQYEDCEQLLQSEISAHQAKQNEFFRISELNLAYKKQATKQYEDFQKEIQSLENMLARQKEKYTRDVKALREKNETDLNEKQKESDAIVEELKIETEAQVNQYKASWIKTQQDYLLVKNELDRQIQILNRTKAVLEMSQNDIREQNQKIKGLDELVENQQNQISTLQGEISCRNQTIEQQESQIQSLNENLRNTQQELQLVNLKWVGVMKNLLFEVNAMGQDLELPNISAQQIDWETYTLCFERFRAADTLMRRCLRENDSLREYNLLLQNDLQEAERRFVLAKEQKQKEIAVWISKFQKLLDKSKSIIRRQDKEALLLKILRKNHQNVIKKLKHENRELITELRKIKSMKYEELTSEMIYIKNQRQLYKLEAEIGTFPSDDEKQDKLPWYLIEAVSDDTEEDPKDFAEEVLGQQNALLKVPTDPDFQIGKNYLCIACHEIFLAHQVVVKPEEIKDVKEVLIQEENEVKPLPKFIVKDSREKDKANPRNPIPAFRINTQVQMTQSRVVQPSAPTEQKTERFATSQGARKKSQDTKNQDVPSVQQIDNVKLYAKKTKAKKAQPSFKSPSWQLQHEVEVTAPLSDIKSFSSQKMDTNREKEHIMVVHEDIFPKGPHDSNPQIDMSRVSSRQARRSSQPQNKTIPDQELTPQIYSQREGFDPQLVTVDEIEKPQPQINDLNLNRLSATPNQYSENQSSSGRPPSIVSNRSLEQVVKSIRMKKLNKEDPVEKVPSIMYTIEQQEHNEELDKSVQAQVQSKTVWVQTDRRDGEDPEVLQARYIEIIKDMEKRQKHTLNSMKQREEERLKELHLRQLKLAELTTHVEDHESKAKLFSAKCDSLQVLNQNLEAKLMQESNLVKQLREDIQQSEEQFEIKMNNAILEAITKENQLKGVIQNLNFTLESKVSEILELKRLYHSEVEGRAIDNEKHITFQEQERLRFEQIIEGLELNLSEQKQKEKEILQELKKMNEYLSTRPARPEDVQLIDQLRREGQKLEQSLKENHRILLHANEIVKYLQLELENYKQMYNLFQQVKQEGHEQVNIENMRQKVFGLAYQKQFLQMLELQKQIAQEEEQQNNNSKINVRPTTTQQKPLNQTQRIPYLPKVDETFNRTKTRRAKYEHLNQSVGDIQVSSSKKPTPAQMRRQFEDTCQVQTAKPIFPKPADQFLRRSQISPCFTNPFENDNILNHAQNFIKNLHSSPNTTRTSKRNDENVVQPIKTNKTNDIDSDQFRQIAEFKQLVEKYDQD